VQPANTPPASAYPWLQERAMYTTPRTCPVCGEGLVITRLNCPACDTSLDGHFKFSRLDQLNAEQAGFVDLFLRCQGKLSWVAQEMKVSYPTVRARLEEVIRAMGYEVMEAPPGEERQRSVEQRQAVLAELETGQITVNEALEQLQGL
jgi:hypothetical protein